MLFTVNEFNNFRNGFQLNDGAYVFVCVPVSGTVEHNKWFCSPTDRLMAVAPPYCTFNHPISMGMHEDCERPWTVSAENAEHNGVGNDDPVP